MPCSLSGVSHGHAPPTTPEAMPSVGSPALRRDCSALLVRVLDAIVQERWDVVRGCVLEAATLSFGDPRPGCQFLLQPPPPGKTATAAAIGTPPALPSLYDVSLLQEWVTTLQQVATVGYDAEEADAPGAPSLPLVLCAPLDAEISTSSGARATGTGTGGVRMVAHWLLVGALEFQRIKDSMHLHTKGGLQHMQMADCSSIADTGEQQAQLRNHLRKAHTVCVSAGRFDVSFVEDGSGRLMLSDLAWHVSTVDEWMSRCDEPQSPPSSHLRDLYALSTGARCPAAGHTSLQRSVSADGPHMSEHKQESWWHKAGHGGASGAPDMRMPVQDQTTSSTSTKTASTSASASSSSVSAPNMRAEHRGSFHPAAASAASASGPPAPAPIPTSSAGGLVALAPGARPMVVPLVGRTAFWSQLEASLFLGKYAGGQQMSRCTSLLSAVLPAEVLSAQQRSRIAAGIFTGWRSLLDAIRSRRDPALSACLFPPLPAGCSSAADLERLVSWSAHVVISARHLDLGDDETPQDDPAVYNAFLQGLLFGKESAPEKERHRGQKWPLVGLFEPSEGIDMQWAARRSGAPEVAGVNGALKYADCHMHFVQGQEDRRFGSDMAQFRIVPAVPVAHCWLVSFDALTRRVDATLVIIVQPSLEDSVSGCIREACQQLPSDRIDLRELAARMRSKLPQGSADAAARAFTQLMQ